MFLISCVLTFGQIDLEHTYDNAFINRIDLEYSGEKYYEFKYTTNEVIMYNADHTLWKTIVLSAPPPTIFTRTRLIHISEAKINPDTNLEIIYSCPGASGYECKIVSEDGAIMATIVNANNIKLDSIPGLPIKLISDFYNGSYSSKVYSIPELMLENIYEEGIVTRINLENSGEKFYVLDNANGNIILYNQNHTLWKTIALPKPAQAVYADVGVVSESLINPDTSLEIAYTYYVLAENVYTYTGKIINENNTELISIPGAKSIVVDVLEGAEVKLLAVIRNFSPSTSLGYLNSTNIYQLPSLVLEKEYESVMSRVKLENSGEKFYTSQNPLTNFVKIYNSNHTLWKSVFLDLAYDIGDVDLHVDFISESKIASDPLIEMGYCYSYNSPLMYTELYGRVTNENGLAYLDTSWPQSFLLSEIPNLPIKLIVLKNFSDPFENTPNYLTEVYTIDAAMGTNGFQNNSTIQITPNPSDAVINFTTSSIIVEASLYNSLGTKVKDFKEFDLTTINVENLPSGIYLLYLMDNNNQKSNHKIIISN